MRRSLGLSTWQLTAPVQAVSRVLDGAPASTALNRAHAVKREDGQVFATSACAGAANASYPVGR